jgi:hypothetical protein
MAVSINSQQFSTPIWDRRSQDGDFFICAARQLDHFSTACQVSILVFDYNVNTLQSVICGYGRREGLTAITKMREYTYNDRLQMCDSMDSPVQPVLIEPYLRYLR